MISDLAYWLRSHLGRAPLLGLGVLVLAGIGFGIYAIAGSSSSDGPSGDAPGPPAVVRTEQRVAQTTDLGFPAFASRNTTRVAGADPTADAAGVALATFPGSGSGDGPTAVSLVDSNDWAGAIAASSLVAEPERLPILFSDGESLPELSSQALDALSPQGSPATDQAQVLRIGEAPAPDGVKSNVLGNDDAATTAAAIAEERVKLTGSDPLHVVVTGLDDPAYAMPAASWAARSGDPVLFTNRDSVPSATISAIKGFKNVTVYVLGPESAVSAKAFDQLKKAAVEVVRIGDEDPVANAVAFARYSDNDFGWNINDPGHGFVIANADRPADAGAASGLSGSGTWGPLLVTDQAKQLPKALSSYLLDLKPGYTDDPTRAVYNHVWVIGDESALSVAAQARVDELAEVAQVSSGSPAPASQGSAGGASTAPAPGNQSKAKGNDTKGNRK